MADPVALDPGDYGGTYKLIGGTPALDLANLVSYRGTARAHDWLDPPGNLARWMRAAGVTASVPTDLAAVARLREALASVFLAVADGADPDRAAFATVATMAEHARGRQRLQWDHAASRGTWALPEPTLPDVVALDAADLLSDDALRRRVGACGECRWVFLDTTRNRSRQWCDPGDCGNRARQRRHYHRSR